MVLCGDLSWGMSLEQAREDFAFLDALPGGGRSCSRETTTTGGPPRPKWNASLPKTGFPPWRSCTTTAGCTASWPCAAPGAGSMRRTRGEHSAKMFNRELIRLEASLKAAGEREKLCFLHYPPLYQGYRCQEILDLLERYGVSRCYYGHLHGGSHRLAVAGQAGDGGVPPGGGRLSRASGRKKSVIKRKILGKISKFWLVKPMLYLVKYHRESIRRRG